MIYLEKLPKNNFEKILPKKKWCDIINMYKPNQGKGEKQMRKEEMNNLIKQIAETLGAVHTHTHTYFIENKKIEIYKTHKLSTL